MNKVIALAEQGKLARVRFKNKKQLMLIHLKLLRDAWQTKWDSLPPNYAAWHRHIVSSIPKHP